MTITEFIVLRSLEQLAAAQGLIPRGVASVRIRETVRDEGFFELSDEDVITSLMALRSRQLVQAKPGLESASWVPTLYGSNVVNA